MEAKNKKIFKLKNKQIQLKKEVKSSKNKLPTYIIGFIFFTALTIYILEDKVYIYFGNSINFIVSGIVLFGIVCIIYTFITYRKIIAKEHQITIINKKLYQLMKL